MAGQTGEVLSPLVLVLSGAGVSLSNPYFTGWWGTVGAGQIATLDVASKRRLLAFWIGHEAGDAAWYVPVAAVLTFARGFLTDAAYQVLLYVSGAVMVAIAAIFLFLAGRIPWKPRQKIQDA